jgi:undecaprenyl diphosphate synthase
MKQDKANAVVPRHIAIIMDGNGRWAKKRFLPRVAGHVRGVKRVKEIVKHSAKIGVKYLTLFVFSKENWQRPQEEVSFLMKLLYQKLDEEFYQLHEDGVKIRFIGDRSRLNAEICQKVSQLEELTCGNQQLNLDIALDYSGSYDIVNAVNTLLKQGVELPITEEIFNQQLLTHPTPAPDLLIRTGGEYRISNFLLWQIAYTELYFSDIFWPDFKPLELDRAIKWYNTRERRFGQISEQL